MKKLSVLFIAIALCCMSCKSEDDCRRCTGTVTNSGDAADWTVCDNDENIFRTNNLTGDSEISTNTLPEAVAFFISIGLECE